MQDRGMMKWNSFDNFGTNKIIIGNITEEKKKIKMPTLSEEQINNINDKIKWYYNNQQDLIIEYYQGGYILNTKGTIKKIDIFNGYLKINQLNIYFNQIINIK